METIKEQFSGHQSSERYFIIKGQIFDGDDFPYLQGTTDTNAPPCMILLAPSANTMGGGVLVSAIPWGRGWGESSPSRAWPLLINYLLFDGWLWNGSLNNTAVGRLPYFHWWGGGMEIICFSRVICTNTFQLHITSNNKSHLRHSKFWL